MLSIGKMASGQEEYYLSLATGEYYTHAGEPPGQWLGLGAQALGLSGRVQGNALRSLFVGKSPDGQVDLIQHGGRKPHNPGWDLTFSAPKSVSVLWSQSDAQTRALIEQAQLAAVQAAARYLQEVAASTRRGKNGHLRDETELIIALFEHSTSRLLDPQLHTHALVLNLGTRADGSTGTVLSNPLYRHKMAAGALYRAELAAQLTRALGLEVERVESCFEIRGVSRQLMQEFSKRRRQIEAALKELGYDTPAAAAVVTKNTRSTKNMVPRAALFEQWRRVGALFGWDVRDLAAARPQPDPEAALRKVAIETVQALTLTNSTFAERELIQHVAIAAQGTGWDAGKVLGFTRDHLEHTAQIVSLGQLNDERHYTTQEILDLEQQMLENVQAMQLCVSHLVANGTLDQVLARRKWRKLRDDKDYVEQLDALKCITLFGGDIKVVNGYAGTGKTYLLAAAREVWESAGFRVCGAALAGRAATELQEKTGITSGTLERWIRDLDRTLWDNLSHHLRQLGKAVFHAPTKPLDPFSLDSNTILVIDEAAMVSTSIMASLVAKVKEAGAKLVLVGDERQLQAIDAGGAFASLREHLDKTDQAELTHIIRQKETWAREAVLKFAQGDAKEALASYAEHGLVTVKDTRAEAMQALLAQWKRDYGAYAPQDHVILVNTNEEAQQLNRLAQKERLKTSWGMRLGHSVNGTRYYRGDRVLFLQNSTHYGVNNGDMGTIELFHERGSRLSMEVRLDNGKTRTINLEYYKEFTLGYAATTYKEQGATLQNTYVLAGGALQDREATYVQASRAVHSTHFFMDALTASEMLPEQARQPKPTAAKEAPRQPVEPRAGEAPAEQSASPKPEAGPDPSARTGAKISAAPQQEAASAGFPLPDLSRIAAAMSQTHQKMLATDVREAALNEAHTQQEARRQQEAHSQARSERNARQAAQEQAQGAQQGQSQQRAGAEARQQEAAREQARRRQAQQKAQQQRPAQAAGLQAAPSKAVRQRNPATVPLPRVRRRVRVIVRRVRIRRRRTL